MKYAFAGPGWMGFMHGLLTERVARIAPEASDLSWSICEVFTDPPPELSPDGRPLAWHAVIDRGGVTFGEGETDAVQFKVVVDYQAVLPLARYDSRGEPARSAELAAMSQALRERGLMKLVGDRAARDPRLGDIHDAIARVTA